MNETNCARREIPALTADQMALVDRIVTEEYGIALLQMMELAGRNLADLARTRFFGGDPRDRRVIVLAGSGGNGGGGLVAARRLHGWCADVAVWLTRDAAELRGAAAHQLRTLHLIGVPIHEPADEPALPPADLIVDALVGYRLAGPPTGTVASLVQAANAHGAPVLSLDLPSGLDATTGAVADPCIRATATLTLALPKIGIWRPGAHEVTGELFLADIGVPDAVYARLGLAVGPIFARQDVIRIG
jgi:NAD(P)H-hydrate epimerase